MYHEYLKFSNRNKKGSIKIFADISVVKISFFHLCLLFKPVESNLNLIDLILGASKQRPKHYKKRPSISKFSIDNLTFVHAIRFYGCT